MHAYEAYEVRSNSNGDFLHNECVWFRTIILATPKVDQEHYTYVTGCSKSLWLLPMFRVAFYLTRGPVFST
jgi:hypothetical protein